MENYAIWILIGDTLLGTLLFVIFAFAVKGLAGEVEVKAPEVKLEKSNEPLGAEHKA